eukprot:1153215-Pelagomonas_calceolata.AAC.15
MHDEVPSGFVSSLPAVRCISFIKTMHGAYLGCAYKMEFVMRLELPEPACMHAKLVQVANKECMHAVVGSPTLTRKCKLNARPKFWMHADIKLLVQNLNIDSRLCNLRSDMLWGHAMQITTGKQDNVEYIPPKHPTCRGASSKQCPRGGPLPPPKCMAFNMLLAHVGQNLGHSSLVAKCCLFFKLSDALEFHYTKLRPQHEPYFLTTLSPFRTNYSTKLGNSW